MPLSYFCDSARTQASRLIAEARDDARVYKCAAAYLFRLGPKGLSVRGSVAPRPCQPASAIPISTIIPKRNSSPTPYDIERSRPPEASAGSDPP